MTGAAEARVDVAVIGAGMAGLRAAALLAAAGRRVVVLDKGRRHGGRMATRRVDDATFDTGAIAFRARSADLRAALTDWVALGHAQSCTRGDLTTSTMTAVTDDKPERWRGTPMMRSLPTALASQLEQGWFPRCQVRLATQVTGIGRDDGGWRIAVTDAASTPPLRATALVLTAPAPQAISLLADAEGRSNGLVSSATRALLADVRYVPSLTVLVRPVDRSLGALGSRAAAQVGPGTAAPDLLRIHDNGWAGASEVTALTLQADPAFSSQHLDEDLDAAAASLAAQATTVMGTELEVVHVHRWRYAQILTGITCTDATRALRDDSSGAPLVIAGDLLAPSWPQVPAAVAAASPDGVERAFLSGGAAAASLLRTVSLR